MNKQLLDTGLRSSLIAPLREISIANFILSTFDF